MQSYQYDIRYPSITEGIFRLLILFTITYLLQIMASIFWGNPYDSLILSTGKSLNFLSIFTHFFVYPVSIHGFISFLFEMMILWSFGSELEQLWGTRNFYRFFFIGIYGGFLSILLIGTFILPGLIAYSPTAGISSLLLAYAVLYPNREVLFFFFIPLKMKWVVLIIFLFLTLGSMSQLILNVGGAIIAGFYLYWIARKGRLKYESNQYFSSRSSSQVNRIFIEEKTKLSLKERIQLKIEEYKKKKRLDKKRKEILQRIEMKEELDRILEKISKHGINSLTREEKKFLDKASREL